MYSIRSTEPFACFQTLHAIPPRLEFLINAATTATLPRIGLLSTDELRIVGLRTILGDGETSTIVPLSPPSALNSSGLELAIVDSSATDDVLHVLAAFRRLRPKLNVIVLGYSSDPEHIERVIGSGAKGYLSHTASESELRMAIDVVRDGSVWAPRKVLARLLESSLRERRSTDRALMTFTPREREVLKLLVTGQPNRQIAQELGIDEGTVKAHIGRLLRKAGVDNRTALSLRAIDGRWIS